MLGIENSSNDDKEETKLTDYYFYAQGIPDNGEIGECKWRYETLSHLTKLTYSFSHDLPLSPSLEDVRGGGNGAVVENGSGILDIS